MEREADQEEIPERDEGRDGEHRRLFETSVDQQELGREDGYD